MKRVAFTLIDSASWMGGYNYLLNLFRALRQYQSGRITPVLFCSDDVAEAELSPFLVIEGLEVIRSAAFNRKQKSIRLLRAFVLGLDDASLELFWEHRIDVVFEIATYYGWRFPIPTIAWMPDFQHRQLRQQFGFLAYWRRELGFRAQIASGRVPMVSSADARKDCETFYPSAIGRTSVVRFAAPIPAHLIEQYPERVVQEYRLPETFFYLPNQFWRHKNHLVVIEAIGELKRRRFDIVIAASGQSHDPRHPQYFSQLMERIDALGLQANFLMLGLIPRLDVISLMRTCRALINPSYFEGWSSTVEEARSLEVPMLLSNIAVHREQMGEGAVYFDPDDAIELANTIQQFADKPLVIDQTVSIGDDHVCRFASDFCAVAEKAWSIQARDRNA